MSSPNPPHVLKFELFVNGAWTDVTSDVYQRNDTKVTIERGYSSEVANTVNPSKINLVLDNRSKNYGPRNPNSIYYGTLKKNTPCRFSVTSAGTNYRFWGEIASLTPSADQSGIDLTVALEAGGVLRRLRQGNKVVKSRPTSYLATTSPTAFWALEDGPSSTQGAATVGSYPMVHQGTTPQNWAATRMQPWLNPTLTGYWLATNDSIFFGRAPAVAAQWAVGFMVSGNGPFSVAVTSDVTSPVFGGSQYTLTYTPSISNLLISGPSGGAGSQSFTLALNMNVGHHFRFATQDSGSDVAFQVHLDGVQIVSSTFVGNAPRPAPLGVVLNLASGVSTANTTGVTMGYVVLWAGGVTIPTIAATYDAASGSPGESAGNRISRICTEQSITLTTIGSLNVTQPCGPQYAMGVADLLQETAAVDGGLLYETMASVGLTYRTLDSIYNEAVGLPLTYATNHHLGGPLAPVDDDQTLINDMTVTRKGGPAQQVTRTTGPLQIAPPPTGVGRYTSSATIACLFDYQATDQAGWIALNKGTYDGARFPNLRFDMSTLPLTQRAQLLALNVGDRITITSPPAWLAPDQIDLLLVGIREEANRFKWYIDCICQPFGPYRIAVADQASGVGNRPSPNDSASTVTTTTNATTWSVATSSGPLWTTAAADFPFSIGCEGEQVTVSNITGGSSPQTFTIVRSVNGIVKAHTAAVVDLWQPMIAGM